MKKLLYIFVVLTLCSWSFLGNIETEEGAKNPFPYLIDSLPKTNLLLDTSEMIFPRNYIQYLGIEKDTIDLSENDENWGNATHNYFEDTLVKNRSVQILVSEKQFLSLKNQQFEIPPPPIMKCDSNGANCVLDEQAIEQMVKKPVGYIQAIPVILANHSKEKVELNVQDGRLLMIQEAKDPSGNWNPIEYWKYAWCGNSYYSYDLHPNNIAIVKINRYEGDFETEFRLKLRNGDSIIYSNSFKGRVNLSQFEIPTHFSESRQKRSFFTDFYR